MRRPRSAGMSGFALVGPIVEEAHQRQSHLRRGLDVLGQLETQLVDADDGEPPRVIAQARCKARWPQRVTMRGDQHQHRRDGKPHEHRQPRKLGRVLGEEGQGHEEQGGGAPGDQRGHGLAMDRDAPPAPIHAADLGQQAINDDRHGGSNHIVLGAAGSLPLDRQEQSGGDAQGVTKRYHAPRMTIGGEMRLASSFWHSKKYSSRQPGATVPNLRILSSLSPVWTMGKLVDLGVSAVTPQSSEGG